MMLGWLRGSRERDDRHLVKGAAQIPPEVDPIDELSRRLGGRSIRRAGRAAQSAPPSPSASLKMTEL